MRSDKYGSTEEKAKQNTGHELGEQNEDLERKWLKTVLIAFFIMWMKNYLNINLNVFFQGFRGVLKSLTFSCIKFKALKNLQLYKK